MIRDAIDIDSAMDTITEASGFDTWRRDSAHVVGIDWRFWFQKDDWTVAVDISRFLQKQLAAGNTALIDVITESVKDSLLLPEYLDVKLQPRSPMKPVFAACIYKYPDGSLVLP